MLPYSKNLIQRAKGLRKNMTKQESHLWYDFLRNYPTKFYRQKVIGNYIVDFYCTSAKIVIELDGSQHYTDNNIEYDQIRTAYLNSQDIEVIRFTNHECNTNFDGVCAMIDKIIMKKIKK